MLSALAKRRLLPAGLRSRLGLPAGHSWDDFLFDRTNERPNSISGHISESFGYRGDLLPLFAENEGPLVHKWHHYIPLYDRYFSRYRSTKVRMLEIGVSKGGSLAMWRKYFGSDAILYGIDIDPRCAAFDGKNAQVRIGSQADRGFLEAVVSEMGGIDIVLDDGSHVMQHIRSSLEILFPLLHNGGTYLIEDLHTCYWRNWGGGYRSGQNIFRLVSELIDDMHHWYHDSGVKHSSISPGVSGIHVHDSIVVLEKDAVAQPVRSEVGLDMFA